MSFREPKWGKVSTGRKEQSKENLSQRQLLINSSDNDSDDQEWIQQLERDYGKRQQKKKKKWTRLEKLLIATLTSCMIVVIFLITALLYSRYKHGETFLQFTLGGQRQCDHQGCIEASYRMMTYMDPSAQPCKSFYDYACGTFFKKQTTESANVKVNSFTQLSYLNRQKLKYILDNLGSDNFQEGPIIQKVKKYYNACLRKDFIESNSNQSLIDLINYVESWAITNISAWNEEQWNFGQALTQIHHLKSMPLFYMYVGPDDKNSSVNIIQIEQSGATLGDETLYKKSNSNKVIKEYRKLMTTVGQLLGASKENSDKQMDEVFEFEKKLASIYESKEQIKEADQIYNKMTVAELLSLCPAIPWLDYMNSMFSRPVKSDEPVIVYTPHYLRNMSDIVIKTERRIIANYMVWHLIKPVLVLLSKPYRMAALELARVESGNKGGIDDGVKSCVTKTDSVLGFATGYLFVKHLEKEGGTFKNEVEKMMSMIKEAFILNLHKVMWMDDETRAQAVKKAGSIIEMIGYPDWIKDMKMLNKYYENLTVTDNPLRNYFNAREFYHEKTMQRRGRHVRRNEWHMTPTEVNAYYNSPSSYLAAPAGILQPPFFSPVLPMAINYGALGSVIGHELIHGFDSQGRHFDNQGNMSPWWSNKSTNAFINQSQCFNGHEVIPLTETIADNGGLKIAYNAFKSNVYIHGADKILPGLKLSPDEMFFLGYAQTWCSSSDKMSHTGQSLNTERLRVDAVLQNSIAFEKAYKCPRGTAMNPVTKCNLW